MIDQEKTENVLKENQIFSIMAEEARKRLIPLLSVKTYKLGEVVIRQGEPSGGYFIIISGKARVVDPEHNNITLATLGKGAGFGEQSLLFDKPASATVRASGALTVLKLAREDFQRLERKYPEIDRQFREIVRKTRETDFLKRVDILSGLKPKEINELLDHIEIIEIKKGKYLFHVGDEGHAAYIVRTGRMQILRERPKKVFFIPRAGDVFGEFSLVKHQPRSASARALEDTRLYKLTQETFQELLPKIQKQIEQIVANRMLQHNTFTSEKKEEKVESYPKFFRQEHNIPLGWFSRKVIGMTANYPSLAGLACVGMIANAHKKRLSPKWNGWAVTKMQENGKETLLDITWHLEEMGFLTRLVRVKFEDLTRMTMPAIILDEENIPCVLFGFYRERAFLGHPLKGLVDISFADFLEFWNGEVLLVSVIPEFGEAKSSLWSIYATFLPLIRPYKGFLLWIFVISGILMLLGLATPFFTQTIIDNVLVFSDKSLLHLMLFGMIFVAAFQLLGSTLRTLLTVSVWQRLESLINTRMFNHIVSLPTHRFERFNVGDYTTRFEENRKLLSMISGTGMTLSMDALTGLFYLILLFRQNPRLAAIGLVFIACLGVLMLLSSPRLRENNKNILEASSRDTSFIIQMVTGIQTVKSLAGETNFFQEGMETLSRKMNAQFIKARFGHIVGLLSIFLSNGATLSLLAYGSYMVLIQQMTVGEYVAFNAIYGMLMAPLERLVSLWDEIQEIRISYERVNDILAMSVERSEQNYELTSVEGYLHIENLSFRYEGAETNTLSDINLEIQPGQKVAFVGRNGCGKSTLINLILGFQQPDHGKIYIDNIDTTTLNPASLRKHIGVVEQRPFLFEGTIKENIIKAVPNLSYEKMIAAAAIAGVKEFADTLPAGFNTRVGEGGMSLSGGQRQRIAIARAIAQEPSILILDEATSALDTETESLIQKNLDQLTQGRTTIVIAHRLSTIMNVDIIVVMDKGRIIDSGTHVSLMESKGLYYYLFTSGEPIAVGRDKSEPNG